MLIAKRVEQIAKTRAVTTQMGFGLGSRIKAGQFDIEGSGIEHDDLPACGGGNGAGLPESLASCSMHRGRYFLSGRFLSVVFKGCSQVLVKRTLVVLPEHEGKICRPHDFSIQYLGSLLRRHSAAVLRRASGFGFAQGHGFPLSLGLVSASFCFGGGDAMNTIRNALDLRHGELGRASFS